jgi:membrane associated rhomboid family serine protease
MFIPLGDAPHERGTPWVTWGLMGLNVAVYLFVCLPLMGSSPQPDDPVLLEYLRVMGGQLGVSPSALAEHISSFDLLLFEYGFRPDAPSLTGLLGSMFLHGGFLHLAGNMLFLYIFGDNVEIRMGRRAYLLTYLGTGAAATLFFMLFQMNSSAPLVGASGAISGVLGCYFVWFPANRVKVLMTLVFFIDIVYVPARWVLGFYIIVENFLPFLLGQAASGVAYGAHLGGFLSGAAFAYVTRQRFSPGRFSWAQAQPLGGRAAPQVTVSTQTPLHGLIDSGAFVEAAGIYRSMGPGQVALITAEDLLALGDWLTESRQFAEALALFQRFIATRQGTAAAPLALAQAHLRAGFIQVHALNNSDAAYQHFTTIVRMGLQGPVGQAALQALQMLQEREAAAAAPPAADS